MSDLKKASRRFLVVATLLVAAALPALADWANQNGGLQDLSTGLVWSPSQVWEFPDWGWSSWSGAKTRAAAYSVTDATGTYDDWRVPTVAQLKTAIVNGTLNELSLRDGSYPYYLVAPIWSSESRGNKAWAVHAVRDSSGQVIGAQASLWLKGSGFDVFFVRP